MVAEAVKIEGFALELKDGDVWRWLGSRHHMVAALAGEVSRRRLEGQELARPQAIYRRLAVEGLGRDGVLLQDDVRLEGEKLSHYFRGAEEAVLLAATIGPALEERVSALFAEGRPVEACLLDAVGSAAVSSVFYHGHSLVCRRAADEGWQAGFCLRPGQHYWGLPGQKAIFQALPTQEMGLRLLPSCFMSPQKSQSAVIPIGGNLRVKGSPDDSQCRYCQATRCPTRRL